MPAVSVDTLKIYGREKANFKKTNEECMPPLRKMENFSFPHLNFSLLNSFNIKQMDLESQKLKN